MRKKKQIWNANYLQEILKDISFTQKIFIHVHDMTFTDLDARKTAINKMDKRMSYCYEVYIFIQEDR